MSWSRRGAIADPRGIPGLWLVAHVVRALETRMRIAFAALLVVACGGGGGGGGDDGMPDASVSVDAPGPMTCEWPGPSCGSTDVAALCGNDQIDDCYWQTMPGHCNFLPGQPEPCDGTARPSCTDLGFPSGQTSCDDCRLVVECDACTPSGGTCVSRPGFDISGGIAISGSLLAISGHVAGTGDTIALYDGPTFVEDVPLDGIITGVGQGWLVVRWQPVRLTPLAADGTLGADVPLPSEVQTAVMAYGAGGRVLLAWNRQVDTQYETRVALTDTSGNIVVDPFTVFTGPAWQAAVTTDGTNFFVGGNGQLARVAPDGTFSVTTGFPSQRVPDLSWHGTAGSYLATDDVGNQVRVQRFDANGATVGPQRNISGRVLDSVANGDELVVLTRANNALELVRLTPQGTTSAGPAIGVTDGSLPALVERFGTQLVVAWDAPTLQLKFVTP